MNVLTVFVLLYLLFTMRTGRLVWSLLSGWRFVLLSFSSSVPVVRSFPCVALHPHLTSWATSRLEHPTFLPLNGRERTHNEDANDEYGNDDLLAEEDEEDEEPSPQEFFVIDWDGCVADARDWRIQAALTITKEVWPHLDLDLDVAAPPPVNANYTTNHLENKNQWLINKLKALSHIFYSPDPQFSLTCEYALATRLLVEEQALDEGRSNGRTGKYSSRYHPQQLQPPPSSSSTTSEPQSSSSSSSSSIERRRQSSPSSGSRPLTVGEIAANWGNGGMLRDTLVTRYHVRYHNPMPELQAALDRYLAKTRHWDSPNTTAPHTPPRLLPDLQYLLQDWHKNRRRAVILLWVSHPSDLPAAMESLAVAHIPCRILPSLQHVLRAHSVSVLVPTASTLHDLLQVCPKESDVYRVSASWETLQGAIPLMGDDVPQQQLQLQQSQLGAGGSCYSTGWWGLGRTLYGSNLCLAYADWAATVHPTLQAAATMNPWTRLLPLTELEELVSFQMISRERNN